MEHPKIFKKVSKVFNGILKNFRNFDKNYQETIDVLQVFGVSEKPRMAAFKSSNSRKSLQKNVEGLCKSFEKPL